MADIYPICVFDLAQDIDLDQAERNVGGGSERQLFRHRGRVTSVLQYRPAPLRVSQDGRPVAIDRWATDPAVDLVVYDFGAVSVTYRMGVAGGLEEVRGASGALRGNERIRRDARSRVEALVGSLVAAPWRPHVADFTEDYIIIGMRAVPEEGPAAVYCEGHAEQIAQILRPEAGPLSTQEIANTTEVRISFGPNDMTIIDWDAAFVLDPDPEDVLAVLEFANVQLLEMRWLDLQLDHAIERSYELLGRRRRWRGIPSARVGTDLRQVATLQLESAVMLERVSNSLKVFGEEYLARLYRLAAGRFHLDQLGASITRKLSTIESIYQKLSDRAATLRMEMLEWVVIVLIASEIILGLLK
jgi:hypothetical protein